MSDWHRIEVLEDGVRVAIVEGPFDHAVREATHYAAMYGQDGGAITVNHIRPRIKHKPPNLPRTPQE